MSNACVCMFCMKIVDELHLCCMIIATCMLVVVGLLQVFVGYRTLFACLMYASMSLYWYDTGPCLL